ncbi:MAG: gluconate 2-dehydrogenase subunit 3 family protein [Flavobacteriaceae bacterium]|nr:gluconate 2-dehydrogenase subunit 3 family protein [Flavobacteriaceae bacterium]
MNRRQALKNFGLGAGILIVGPSTLSLLQSCKNEPRNNWEPTFLNISNGLALKQILNVIIPKTDTPGANELNLAQFIDSYMNQVASEERQQNFKRSADAFAVAFKEEFGKDLDKGKEKDFEEIISKYLSASLEEQEIFAKMETETQDPIDKIPELKMDPDAGSLSYLKNVRQMAIWAWKTSEEIGENVLWYDPIPGQYIACGPVEELGNGKAMSL